MIKQQIHTFNVSNEDVIEIIERFSREQFVPEPYEPMAYADIHLPIGHEQVMLSPAEQGRILQELNIQKNETVLEVGTGTGYVTALLASQAKHVYSIDVFEDFVKQAQTNLNLLNIANVTLEVGNAANGWLAHQPYDVIVITGALHQLPNDFLEELNVGGRIFAILGTSPAMKAVMITKTKKGFETQSLFDTDIPVLLHAAEEPTFQF